MNKIFKQTIFFLIFLISISRCYAEEPQSIPVTNPSQRISDPNTGLSILPPSGEGWSFIPNLPTGGINFAKMIYLPSHTWACTLIVIPIDRSFKNNEEFLKFVKQMVDADTDKNRFKRIKSNYQLSQRFSSFSVEHRFRATDMLPTSIYGRPVFLNVHGYIFVHPKKSNYVVDIVYSERWLEKNFTSDIEKIGQEFIDNLMIE